MEYSTPPEGDTEAKTRARRRRWPLALLPAAVALELAASGSPPLVERLYSQSFYRVVSATFTAALGRVPFSVGEALLWAGVGGAAAWTVRRLRRLVRARGRRRAVLVSTLADGWAAAGALCLAFVILWGLNYRRPPYAVLAGLDARPATVGELTAVCERLIGETNRARDSVPEDAAGVAWLADGRPGALRRAPAGYGEAARMEPLLAGGSAPAKPVLISTVLSYLGISGIFSPFTGEANVNMTLPDPDVPFAACHELAHARGFAREDEANYVGYLACTRHPDSDFRYSGLLAASVYAMNELARVDREGHLRLDGRRAPGVRRDLAALVAWAERYRGPAERVSQAVNNAYLKTQGQKEGVRSYGRMVDLLIAEERSRLTAGR
ncbi:MAG TPA: DUF3810 domain-containing protein [Vicinamibacteria bacterium]|nr:DUF3810 domain-containing protein [Vicinamibacteria bacterium]